MSAKLPTERYMIGVQAYMKCYSMARQCLLNEAWKEVAAQQQVGRCFQHDTYKGY